MASWPLVVAWSGFRWHAPTRTLSFSPARPAPFRSFFSTGSAWGTVSIDADAVALSLDHGALQLDELRLHDRALSLPDGGVSLVAGDTTQIPIT